ncbi:MAG: hypothetical protein E7646_05405 [Ruminococcaceae bacterium]|nr:hypothetical protein [Oscillospiraceae bacterium]
MFTVIICSEAFGQSCKQTYGEFLAPYMKSKEYAFCYWRPDADTLDEALPDLKGIIADKPKWRAVAIADATIFSSELLSQQNPFDFVKTDSSMPVLANGEDVLQYREAKRMAREASLDNPLAKLSLWLSGTPSTELVDLSEEYASLGDIDDPGYFEGLKEKGVDPLELELERQAVEKSLFFKKHFCCEGELKRKPAELIAFAERICVDDIRACKNAWNSGEEHEYSRFVQENYYSDKLRFVLSDVTYVKGERVESDWFEFLSLVLILCVNEQPDDCFRQDRVYRLALKLHKERMADFCYGYLAKLYATLRNVKGAQSRIAQLKKEALSRKTVEELFISDEYIPVEVDSEFDTKELYCSYKGIGMSKNCPKDEQRFWDDQYQRIRKELVKYLREPKRAVKTATTVTLRSKSFIDDDRAGALNEYQLEDVSIRLLEEEEKAVKLSEPGLFDGKESREQVEEADKRIRRMISKRMTRKKTVVIGSVALAAYFIGFLPLLFTNTGSVAAVMTNICLTAGALLVFLGAGYIALRLFKKRLVDSFKHFNYVIGGIISGVKGYLESFGNYLSSTCNVMREHSVINACEHDRNERLGILKKHEHYISAQIYKTQNVFYKSIKLRKGKLPDAEPFLYDFTQNRRYSFGINEVAKPGMTEYLYKGNAIKLPIDYIEAIELTREELYD